MQEMTMNELSTNNGIIKVTLLNVFIYTPPVTHIYLFLGEFMYIHDEQKSKELPHYYRV